MEQHPVPQQISSYQFRLVGDMTLKQFLELAGGALVGLLVYSSAIPPLFKWPIIAACVLFGAALAFLPIEDRPLEIWVIAFFRSIYSPTLYYWAKTNVKPQYFQEESGDIPLVGVIAPHGEGELKKYLAEKPSSKNPFFAKMEDFEKGYLSKLTGLFSQSQPQTATVTPGNSQPPVQPTATDNILQAQQRASEQAKNLEIPETQFVKTTPQQQTEEMPPTSIFQDQVNIPKNPPAAQVVPKTIPAPMPAPQIVQQAQFSVTASPPMPPTQANTLSGQVMDASGRIIEGAILEIKDAAGRPVRAVKTNKLGHFYIVTPLSNGVYEIITEKDGYFFDRISFTAEGNIIPSIAIASKANG